MATSEAAPSARATSAASTLTEPVAVALGPSWAWPTAAARMRAAASASRAPWAATSWGAITTKPPAEAWATPSASIPPAPRRASAPMVAWPAPWALKRAAAAASAWTRAPERACVSTAVRVACARAAASKR
ncbi:hypothetical protein D3C87_1502360 [compost metagenome]